MKKTLSILAAVALLLSAGSAMADQTAEQTVNLALSEILNFSISGPVSFNVATTEDARNGVTDTSSSFHIFSNKMVMWKITGKLSEGMPAGQTLSLGLPWTCQSYSMNMFTRAFSQQECAGYSVMQENGGIPTVLTASDQDLMLMLISAIDTPPMTMTYKWTPGNSTLHGFSRTTTLTLVEY